ncbi:unnamed protein product [Closterium sp. NIES-53]
MAATSLQCKLSLGSLVKADVSLRQGPAVVSFPQRRVTVRAERNDYTGYVEKDTAGQENIYAVEVRVKSSSFANLRLCDESQLDNGNRTIINAACTCSKRAGPS